MQRYACFAIAGCDGRIQNEKKFEGRAGSADIFGMDFARVLFLPTLVVFAAALTGCMTTPMDINTDPQDESEQRFGKAGTSRTTSPTPVFKNIGALQSDLGMTRALTNLGFTERSFNPCTYGLSNSCADQYLTVVHFQLLCRDSEGTVSAIPLALTPVVYPRIKWAVAGQSGGSPTDRNGYGRFTVISPRPLRGRLTLRKGAHYVGVSINDLSKLVLPKNWCS